MIKKLLGILLTAFMLSQMLSGTVFASENQSVSFIDVKDTDWFYDSVEYVCSRGVMNGTGNTTFSPGAAVTRGMAVTILYRMESMPATVNRVKFSDVPKGEYYSDAVVWASENNIASGYSSEQFRPDETITREQMITVLYRYARLKDCDITSTGNIMDFSDVGAVESYALNPVKWALGKGLISGTGESVIAPGRSLTRAQNAVMLKRFCENILLSDAVVHENRAIGLKMEFPATWKNNYRVEENPNASDGIIIETEWGGILCYVFREAAAQWKESVENDEIPVEYRILAKNDKYVYVIYFASDVNYEGMNQSRIYQKMRADLDNIRVEIL